MPSHEFKLRQYIFWGGINLRNKEKLSPANVKHTFLISNISKILKSEKGKALVKYIDFYYMYSVIPRRSRKSLSQPIFDGNLAPFCSTTIQVETAKQF